MDGLAILFIVFLGASIAIVLLARAKPGATSGGPETPAAGAWGELVDRRQGEVDALAAQAAADEERRFKEQYRAELIRSKWRADVEREVLPAHPQPAPDAPRCARCGAGKLGRFCANCGERAGD